MHWSYCRLALNHRYICCGPLIFQADGLSYIILYATSSYIRLHFVQSWKYWPDCFHISSNMPLEKHCSYDYLAPQKPYLFESIHDSSDRKISYGRGPMQNIFQTLHIHELYVYFCICIRMLWMYVYILCPSSLCWFYKNNSSKYNPNCIIFIY